MYMMASGNKSAMLICDLKINIAYQSKFSFAIAR